MTHLRDGQATDEDMRLLMQAAEAILDSPTVDTAVHLFFQNKKVLAHNLRPLRKFAQTTGNHIALSAAQHEPPGTDDVTQDSAGGLPNLTYLAVGVPVMLVRNLWTEYGLVRRQVYVYTVRQRTHELVHR